MASARNRSRRQARTAPFRDPKPLILVVSEGKLTEPEYLRGLQRACRNPRVTIKVAEVWLLLHFIDNPGAHHRKKMTKRLKQLVPQYDKHIDFGTYERGYSEAVKRARRMDEEAEDASERHRNPTTGVYQLTELICGS